MENSTNIVKVKEAKRLCLDLKCTKADKLTKANVGKLLWDAAALEVLMGGQNESGIDAIVSYAKSIKDSSLRQEVVEIISSEIDSILTGIEHTIMDFETAKDELEELL